MRVITALALLVLVTACLAEEQEAKDKDVRRSKRALQVGKLRARNYNNNDLDYKLDQILEDLEYIKNELVSSTDWDASYSSTFSDDYATLTPLSLTPFEWEPYPYKKRTENTPRQNTLQVGKLRARNYNNNDLNYKLDQILEDLEYIKNELVSSTDWDASYSSTFSDDYATLTPLSLTPFEWEPYPYKKRTENTPRQNNAELKGLLDKLKMMLRERKDKQ